MGIKAPTPTAADCIAATKDSHGLISVIQQRLNVSRAQVYILLNKYPTFNQAREDERERRKDRVELTIDQLTTGYWASDPQNAERRVYIPPNPTMIIFFAKTQMRDRGYTERQEITGADGGEIIIKVIHE